MIFLLLASSFAAVDRVGAAFENLNRNSDVVAAQPKIMSESFLANSTTSVFLSPTSTSIGHSVNCTAIVSGLDPTGSVNWTASSSTGSFSSSYGILLGGRTSTTYVDNFTGYITITAFYNGDVYNAPSAGSAPLTVFVNITTGANVTVTLLPSLELTFANVTSAGYAVANGIPTVQAPPLDNPIGPYYDVNVNAGYVGPITVRVAFNGSNMTRDQKLALRMMQYSPIPGDIRLPYGAIDMRDVAYVARQMGTTPASPNWDPAADITGPVYLVPDGKVDLRDIALVARSFLQTRQWVDITAYVDPINNVVYGETTHFSLIGIH